MNFIWIGDVVLIFWAVIVIFILINVFEKNGISDLKNNIYNVKNEILTTLFFVVFQLVSCILEINMTMSKKDNNVLCGCAMFLYFFLKFLRMNKENIEPNIFDYFELFWFSVLPFCGVILQVLFLIVIIALSYFLAYLNFYKKNDFIKTIILCSEEFVVCIVCTVFEEDIFSIYSVVLFCEVVVGTINKKVFNYIDIFHNDKCKWAIDIEW